MLSVEPVAGALHHLRDLLGNNTQVATYVTLRPRSELRGTWVLGLRIPGLSATSYLVPLSSACSFRLGLCARRDDDGISACQVVC